MTGREASQPNVPQPEPVPVGEGFRIDSPTSEELAEVLRAAVDYRGDVTLILRGGEEQRPESPDPRGFGGRRDAGQDRSQNRNDEYEGWYQRMADAAPQLNSTLVFELGGIHGR